MGFIEDNDDECSVNTNEYSDNITVRSSASSLKYYPDECASEECSILISPHNGPFEFYNSSTNKSGSHELETKQQAAAKRPESQTSVLSNFISNLKFEDGFCAVKSSSDKGGFLNAATSRNQLGKIVYFFN